MKRICCTAALVLVAATVTPLFADDLVFHDLAPCRVIDTRDGSGASTSDNGPAGPLSNPGPHLFRLQGFCGIPDGAAAAELNFSVIQPSKGGDLRALPSDGPNPVVATMSYEPGILALSNSVIVPLGAVAAPADNDLKVLIGMVGSGNIQLAIDVTGYLDTLVTAGGDITGVAGGTGLSETPTGGASGDVTVDIEPSYALPQVCADGQAAVWIDASDTWGCSTLATGDITGVAGGTGLSETPAGGASGDVTVDLETSYALPQVCADGQVPAWIDASDTWGCATLPVAGGGDITGVTGGTGLSETPTGGASGDVTVDLEASYALPQACADGEVPVWIDASNTWGCAPPAGGGFVGGKNGIYVVETGTGTFGAGTRDSATAACEDGNDIPLGGGCEVPPGQQPAGNNPGVVVEHFTNANYATTSSAAALTCTFFNHDSVSRNANAWLACGCVPPFVPAGNCV